MSNDRKSGRPGPGRPDALTLWLRLVDDWLIRPIIDLASRIANVATGSDRRRPGQRPESRHGRGGRR